MSATLIWWGHSTCELITGEGLHVLIDPWFKGNPSCPKQELPDNVDLILVTHDHKDHTANVIEIASSTGAKVVAQPETIARLTKDGLPEGAGAGMNIGGTYRMKDLAAKMVHAFHTSISGAPAGYIMTIGDKRVYHLGDTGLFRDLELFGEMYTIDLALIPAGGWYTMDPDDAAIAARMLKARRVMPIHYATNAFLVQDAAPFREAVKREAPGIEVLTPAAGDPLQI